MMARHGTLTGYTKDGCHCTACRAANARWSKQRRLRQDEGTWRPFVPVEQALEIIEQLRAAGLSAHSIAQAANLATGVVSLLVWDSPRKPKKVRPETLAALRHALRSPNIPEGAFIDATGTRRRLEALAVQGWSHRWVAQQLGCSTTHVAAMRQRPRVTKRNADRIRALYDEVSMRIGPAPEQHRRRSIRLGWVPPLAWDEETIDDPAATPSLGPASRSKGGRPVFDLDEVDHLLACGVSPHQVVAQIGANPGSIARAAYRAGRDELAPRFAALLHRDWSKAS